MDELKDRLRATALESRRRLTRGERRDASRAITERLLTLPDLRRTRTVLVYAAMADEVDLGELVGPLHERGVRLLFPRVRGPELELVETADLLTLRLGFRGIREPTGPSVDPGLVEAALLPGSAFDPHGGRLGQGGGHYDRLLARMPERCLRVGVCFACQVVPRVPLDVHDEPVDLVVTERARYRTEARLLPDDA